MKKDLVVNMGCCAIVLISVVFVVLMLHQDKVACYSNVTKKHHVEKDVDFSLNYDQRYLDILNLLPQHRHYKNKLMLVSAYCPCRVCCGRWSKAKTTKSGRSAFLAGVAVDPRVISLGSKLIIPGYMNGKEVTADDTGSRITGNHIDVRMTNHKEALKWGMKTIVVTIVSVHKTPNQ